MCQTKLIKTVGTTHPNHPPAKPPTSHQQPQSTTSLLLHDGESDDDDEMRKIHSYVDAWEIVTGREGQREREREKERERDTRVNQLFAPTIELQSGAAAGWSTERQPQATQRPVKALERESLPTI